MFFLRDHIRDALFMRRILHFRVLCPNHKVCMGQRRHEQLRRARNHNSFLVGAKTWSTHQELPTAMQGGQPQKIPATTLAWKALAGSADALQRFREGILHSRVCFAAGAPPWVNRGAPSPARLLQPGPCTRMVTGSGCLHLGRKGERA
jgi:hypothetical protein